MGSDGDGMMVSRVSRVYVYTARESTREQLLAGIRRADIGVERGKQEKGGAFKAGSQWQPCSQFTPDRSHRIESNVPTWGIEYSPGGSRKSPPG